MASVLEHTGTTVKEQMPEIQKVFLRSDNACCYHCGNFGYPFMEFPTEQVVKLDNQIDDENCFHNSTILLQIKREILCHLTLG